MIASRSVPPAAERRTHPGHGGISEGAPGERDTTAPHVFTASAAADGSGGGRLPRALARQQDDLGAGAPTAPGAPPW